MEISKEMHSRIEKVIRDRFGTVDNVEMKMSFDEDGEDILLIQMSLSKDTTDFADKFFGLTDLVRKAMDEQMQMRGIFPSISLMREHA